MSDDSFNQTAPAPNGGATSPIARALAVARRKLMEAWRPTNPFQAHSETDRVVSAEILPLDARRDDADGFIRRDAAERLDETTFIDGKSM